jgi:hypothetical protein
VPNTQDYLVTVLGAPDPVVVEYALPNWTIGQQGGSYFSGRAGDVLPANATLEAQVYALDGTGWAVASSAPTSFQTGP